MATLHALSKACASGTSLKCLLPYTTHFFCPLPRLFENTVLFWYLAQAQSCVEEDIPLP